MLSFFLVRGGVVSYVLQSLGQPVLEILKPCGFRLWFLHVSLSTYSCIVPSHFPEELELDRAQHLYRLDITIANRIHGAENAYLNVVTSKSFSFSATIELQPFVAETACQEITLQCTVTVRRL